MVWGCLYCFILPLPMLRPLTLEKPFLHWGPHSSVQPLELSVSHPSCRLSAWIPVPRWNLQDGVLTGLWVTWPCSYRARNGEHLFPVSLVWSPDLPSA